MSIGSTGPVELRPIKRWDSRSGDTIVRRFRGDEFQISALAAYHKSEGRSVENQPDEDGAYHTLMVTLGSEDSQPENQPLSDQWLPVTNTLEKHLWEHPKITKELDKIPWSTVEKAETANKLKRWMEDWLSGATEVQIAGGSTEPLNLSVFETLVTSLGMTWSVFFGYLQARIKGVEAWPISQHVLRHSLVIAANSSLRPSRVNVGKIFTTAELKSVEAIPDNIKFDMPNGYWLKQSPTGPEQVASGKWTIVQEYWHADEYDTWVYDRAVL